MPRTIDSLVANHRAAQQLRRAGRPIWSHTVRLLQPREAGGPDLTDEQTAAVAKEYAEALKKALPAAWLEMDSDDFDDDLDIIVENLANFDPSEMQQMPADELSSLVDQLYDWADHKRVWIEFEDRQPAEEGRASLMVSPNQPDV